MMLWFALVIPVIGAWVLHRVWPHRTEWWEYVLPLAVSAVLVFVSKVSIEHMQVYSTEYWGSAVKEARYYEDWNEYVHRTCSRSYPCGKSTCVTYYDCSYVRYHPAVWEAHTTSGERVAISEEKYRELVARFGLQEFVDLGRNYHSNDGDLYKTLWAGDSARLEPVTTVHSYENRVKAADASIFHFERVSEERADSLGLFDYPEVSHNYQRVLLGYDGPGRQVAESRLQWWNATLGPKNESRIFVLVFPGKPREWGQLQEWYWMGGNMNEVVVCVGTDGLGRISWCYPISWGTNHSLQADVRQWAEADGRTVPELCGQVGRFVERDFERRDFEEFNYLTVDPPWWAILLTYLLTAAATVACCKLAITN